MQKITKISLLILGALIIVLSTFIWRSYQNRQELETKIKDKQRVLNTNTDYERIYDKLELIDKYIQIWKSQNPTYHCNTHLSILENILFKKLDLEERLCAYSDYQELMDHKTKKFIPDSVLHLLDMQPILEILADKDEGTILRIWTSGFAGIVSYQELSYIDNQYTSYFAYLESGTWLIIHKKKWDVFSAKLQKNLEVFEIDDSLGIHKNRIHNLIKNTNIDRLKGEGENKQIAVLGGSFDYIEYAHKDEQGELQHFFTFKDFGYEKTEELFTEAYRELMKESGFWEQHNN
ncbi:MAG: hypothetical protein MK212_18260 [Saprospiraceae bacterium]|nr:hypothetical protein [Saprospiraceae bacterium]